LAAYNYSPAKHCANCGTALSPEDLICPNCRRFAYAEELEQIATRARQLMAFGQLEPARDQWLAALKLMPPQSNQYQAVLKEVQKLNYKLNPIPENAPKKTDWKKRLGPLGVVIAAIVKFKTVGLLFLTKGKFLLLGLTHFKMIFSVLAFLGVYWALFGWWFAIGFTVSIFLHEMGHYLVARRFGFAAELPMFIPGLGAYVKWAGAGVAPGIRGQISLAGPLFGLISGLISYGIFLSTGSGVWLAIAHVAAWINLLNLIPVGIFDGGSAMSGLGRQERMAVLVVSLAMWFFLGEFLYLAIAAATGYRLWKKDFPTEPNHTLGFYFVGLIMACGFLSWFSLIQAQQIFHR
jgi:Zn-dependent protease/predicted nucleic acid-binding Zn ribbon protein